MAAAPSYGQYGMRYGDYDDWWEVEGITAGPMYSYRLNAKAALDLKAMFGLLLLTPIVDSYNTADGTGDGLAVDLRVAVRYDVTPRWALFVEGGLQSSSVSFPSGARKDFRALISGFGIAFRPAW